MLKQTAISFFIICQLKLVHSGGLRGLQDDIPHKVSPAEQCTFALPPAVPYYWDASCAMGQLGCLADGLHTECRFCGEAPYLGLQCPSDAVVPSEQVCSFVNAPVTPFFWDATCQMGMKGCFADGKHIGCRFCGMGDYADIECPSSVCNFPNEPISPYYWDDLCVMGMLGCNADGIHVQCRFCDKYPFNNVTCPESARPPYGKCWFPTQPGDKYYWDTNCAWGDLGCWADGIHSECRFCGGDGPYVSIPCP